MSDPLLDRAGISESELVEVLALVAGTDVVELRVRFGDGGEIRLRRPPSEMPAAPGERAHSSPQPAGEAVSLAISSPLVGIFHANVRAGDTVHPGQSIGAIEALGMPTSVDAPQSGTVEDLLVSDGAPVEYGQPLLVLRRARPAG